MKTKLLLVLGGLLIVIVGAGAGVMAAKQAGKTAGAAINNNMVKTSTEVGSSDTKTFGDTATGELQKGGLGVDGTHKLIRDGGPSQTVYMISSVVDLDQFVGKKVQVWGQTIKAQKAPWLMDVGRVKIVE